VNIKLHFSINSALVLRGTGKASGAKKGIEELKLRREEHPDKI